MKSILLIVLLLLPLWGDMDAQIEAIQKAPVAERFKLMNDFKKRVAQMHEKERAETLEKIHSTIKKKQGIDFLDGLHSYKNKRTENNISYNLESINDNIDDNRDDQRDDK